MLSWLLLTEWFVHLKKGSLRPVSAYAVEIPNWLLSFAAETVTNDDRGNKRCAKLSSKRTSALKAGCRVFDSHPSKLVVFSHKPLGIHWVFSVITFARKSKTEN